MYSCGKREEGSLECVRLLLDTVEQLVVSLKRQRCSKSVMHGLSYQVYSNISFIDLALAPEVEIAPIDG